MRLSGKVALIAGGASGIGAAEARIFAREGARVVVADIQEDLGGTVAQDIVQAGGEATFQRLDVRRADQWAEAVRATVQRYGKLDIMVNNAGANFRVSFDDQTEQMWDEVMAVNARGCFLGVKAVVPEMRRNGGGSIVLLSSIAGAKGHVGGPAYACSKAAVAILARCAARSYAPDRIRVNAIQPGSTDTPFLRETKSYSLNTHETDISLPDNYRRRAEASPQNRLASPEEIAYGALFLASDEASFVTGSLLVMDGGTIA